MEAPISAYGWPSLRVDDWSPTRDTLHMWTQIVGKVRLTHMPLINHWWQVTLYVSPRGLTTGAIPYGTAVFDMEFDFVDQCPGDPSQRRKQAFGATRLQTGGRVYGETLSALDSLGIASRIVAPQRGRPAIPFAEDYEHAEYDADAAHLFWQQLVQAHRVFLNFRASFAGKVSPVHFFWGALDLACTRFSGRPARRMPAEPNCPDWVMVEGYSHELSSCGFWPGGGEEGAFYSYAYPEPQGFAEYRVEPDAAYYSDEYKQFLLPYEAVRTADNPDQTLSSFCTAPMRRRRAGGWDRDALEVDPHRLPPNDVSGAGPAGDK